VELGLARWIMCRVCIGVSVEKRPLAKGPQAILDMCMA
jgi:hypothetical protein